MSFAVESSDSEFEGRIHELIENGLALYGGGDLEGAMNAWRHALALDSDNRRAADYVAYIKRHFDMEDEETLEHGPFAPADVELEIPFGLEGLAPMSGEDIEAYESFEVIGTPSDSGDFDEAVPTRIRQAVSAQELDEGWSIEGDETISGGFSSPIISVRTDVPSDDEPDDVRDELSEPDLRAAIASVEADLEEISFQGLADDDDDDALPAPEAASRQGKTMAADDPESTDPKPASPSSTDPSSTDPSSTDPSSTMLGFPTPPVPHEGPGRETAEISPLELSEALSALSLDGADVNDGVVELDRAPVSPQPLPETVRVETLSDVDFDLGESSADEPARDFESRPYASVAILGEDESSMGDASISFRDPAEAGLVEVEPAGKELEFQLAELEAELRTGSREVEWTKHSTAANSVDPRLAAGASGRATIEPLERPQRRSSPPRRRSSPTSAPPQGLDSVRAAINELVDSHPPIGESREDSMRRRIAGFLACAETELGRDELVTAAVAADMALEESPDSALGQKLIHERSELLVSVFRRFLGDQSGIVAVALPLHELAKHRLDHRTAFLLSRVDGTLTIEDVLDVSGMARLEAFRSLARLVLQGILEVR